MHVARSTVCLRRLKASAVCELPCGWTSRRSRRWMTTSSSASTPLSAHGPSEPLRARRMRINDAEHPYFAQLFWAGLATVALLPSTVAPVGLTAEGLPVGMQIVGPEFADLGTIWLAGELARLIGGF